MAALPISEEGVRTRTVSWTDPARARFQLRDLDGYEQLRAMMRGDAAPPPAAALLGMEITEVARGRVVFSLVADELHENPMGTMHGGIIATLVDSAMGCAVASSLPAGAGYTTLELKTNFVRPIVQATGRVRRKVVPK
ncbi:MAG: PaaI family thioesterase [Actinomycetota bacterium]|nr:PaaI family thioesterase [Actinomycetota bacterium]